MPFATGAYAKRVTASARKIPRLVEIRHASWLNPAFVRLVMAGPGLADFPQPAAADSYIKVILQDPRTPFRRDLDLAAARAELPEQLWPRIRAYTVRDWSDQRRELTIDVLVHHDQHGPVGPGSAWAAAAQAGDELHLTGPGGSFHPDPDAPWQLLLGDLSALPAISVIAHCPSSQPSWIFLEIDHPEQALDLPELAEGRTITWLRTNGQPRGAALLTALAQLPVPQSPNGQAFIHGEAGWVRQARRFVLTHWQLPLTGLSASGYWRTGSTDEAWRATKAAWLTDPGPATNRSESTSSTE